MKLFYMFIVQQKKKNGIPLKNLECHLFCSHPEKLYMLIEAGVPNEMKWVWKLKLVREWIYMSSLKAIVYKFVSNGVNPSRLREFF